MKRLLCALALMLIPASTNADGLSGSITPQLGGGISFGFDGGISGNGKIAPQPTGDILLVDGVSLILQTDGASLICRAGGC